MLAREIDERLNDHTGATPSPNLQADSTPYTDIEAELNLRRPKGSNARHITTLAAENIFSAPQFGASAAVP